MAQTVVGISDARAAEENVLREARAQIATSSEGFRQAMAGHREAIGAAIGETREQSAALVARLGKIADAVEQREREAHAARAARMAETENRMRTLVGETAEATRSLAATQRALEGLVAAIEIGKSALVHWPRDVPGHDRMQNGGGYDVPDGDASEAGRIDKGVEEAVR